MESIAAHVERFEPRVQRCREAFAAQFRAQPSVVATAPGRTEIIGNHTDHNHGLVAAAAIGIDALLVARRVEEPRITLYSFGHEPLFRVDLTDLRPSAPAANDTERLLRGVVAGCAERGLGWSGFEAVLDSRVLPGSGVSSSAAFENVIATACAALNGYRLDAVQTALIGQYAENVFMGKPSGLMDQLASAGGGCSIIDFANPTAPSVDPLDLGLEEAGLQLVVVNSGGSHADLTDEYAAIPRQMRAIARALGGTVLRDCTTEQLLAAVPRLRTEVGDQAVLRALHFVAENERVSALRGAQGDAAAVLRIIQESGDSSWTLLQNVTPAAAGSEQPVTLALALVGRYLRHRGVPGAYRVHGGGFAGTVLCVLPHDEIAALAGELEPVFGAGAVIPLRLRRLGAAAATL